MIEHRNGKWIVELERFQDYDDGWFPVVRFVGDTKGEVATMIAEEIAKQTAIGINYPEEAMATAHTKRLYDCLEDLVDFPA